MKPNFPANDNCILPGYALTHHARQRMLHRGLKLEAVGVALLYGRVASVRGAVIHAIGRKEVRFYAREGIDLSRYEGVHVVCSSDGAILTAYWNHDFRGLRPGPRPRAPRDAA
ncbi:hypothetical protein WME99_05730 [Sorangium sp. So ce136]|uniref:DUF4258 domain-containing protein n=1 Tax=Sorangium sp. So ce136 TaxID=3133284 RepID=UPI003F12BDD6